MKIVAHCFAENASITPTKMDFKFMSYDANILSMDNKLTLQISKALSTSDIALAGATPNFVPNSAHPWIVF